MSLEEACPPTLLRVRPHAARTFTCLLTPQARPGDQQVNALLATLSHPQSLHCILFLRADVGLQPTEASVMNLLAIESECFINCEMSTGAAPGTSHWTAGLVQSYQEELRSFSLIVGAGSNDPLMLPIATLLATLFSIERA